MIIRILYLITVITIRSAENFFVSARDVTEASEKADHIVANTKEYVRVSSVAEHPTRLITYNENSQ